MKLLVLTDSEYRLLLELVQDGRQHSPYRDDEWYEKAGVYGVVNHPHDLSPAPQEAFLTAIDEAYGRDPEAVEIAAEKLVERVRGEG